ncbi:acetylxylan esterase [Pirellulaceae bacterium SH467]
MKTNRSPIRRTGSLRRTLFSLLACGCFAVPLSSNAFSQRRDVNYDEAKIDVGVLPNPMVLPSGAKATRENWESHREALVKLLAEHQFGFAPSGAVELKSEVVEESTMHDGKTLRRQIVVTLKTPSAEHAVDLAIFLPKGKKVKGTFLGLNFQGNHSIDGDPALRIPKSWIANNKDTGVTNNQANEQGRGKQSRRWPIEEITARGYAVATAYYGDIDPDFDDGFNNGVHRLYPDQKPDANHPTRWGTIAAWSWGISRLLDVVSQQPELKETHYAVVGHSRLGKAALWAGANDERFSLVISNNSGCGGAALERRNFGETVEIINNSFPHWFCGNFKKYAKNEKSMPHDAHFIIASIAPRAVYIASATEDQWADPKGEYLSGYFATPVYKMLGLAGLEGDTPPAPDTSVGGTIGYHARTGAHDILSFDWQRYMDFADRQWKK